MTYISTKLKREIIIDEIITIHYFEYMKDFFFAGESHDFWEFLYVDKGCITVWGGEDEYLMNAGSIIFHRPDEFHAIRAEGGKAPCLVVISFHCHSPAIRFFYNLNCTLNIRERKLISLILTEAKQAFTTPLHIPSVEQVIPDPDAPFGSQQLILTYLEELLLGIRRSYSDTGSEDPVVPLPPNTDPPTKSDRMEQILQFMEFHICEHLRVQDICDASSLSRSALQDLFHQQKGCGAIDYFNHMKVERAKEIIRDERMNFTEIAYFLSYSSLQYFSKQFKKATGMSPLEYSNSVKTITAAVKSAPPQADRKNMKGPVEV